MSAPSLICPEPLAPTHSDLPDDWARFDALLSAARAGRIPALPAGSPLTLCVHVSTTAPGPAALHAYKRATNLWKNTLTGDGMTKPRASMKNEKPELIPAYVIENAWLALDAEIGYLDTILAWWTCQPAAQQGLTLHKELTLCA